MANHSFQDKAVPQVQLGNPSKLEAMTGSETRQPAFEEQLKSVESTFVAADKSWPNGASYETARSLFADAIKEWRLCEELRLSGLLDEIRATSSGQVAELARDEKLRTKAAAELEKSFEAARDRGVHENRASHAFHQGMEYLDHTSR